MNNYYCILCTQCIKDYVIIYLFLVQFKLKQKKKKVRFWFTGLLKHLVSSVSPIRSCCFFPPYRFLSYYLLFSLIKPSRLQKWGFQILWNQKNVGLNKAWCGQAKVGEKKKSNLSISLWGHCHVWCMIPFIYPEPE